MKGPLGGEGPKVVGRLERGEFDLIAVGRALLADPQWAQKVRSGGEDLRDFAAASLG